MLGFEAEVVEKWIPKANIRKDLFGCIDIIAVSIAKGTYGIQTTTMSNKSSRLSKIRQSSILKTWLGAGNKMELWCWRQLKSGWQVDITKF